LLYSKRNLAYSAIIASKARIKLNNSLNLVLKSGGRIFYTDTDSIFAGYKDNQLGKSLGDITWTKTYDDAVFIASKFYFLKGESIKLKGVNRNNYTYEEIKNKFYSNETKLIFGEQLSFPKTNFVIYENIKDKCINVSEYDKRIYSEDKKNTTPLTFQTDSV
jgi:hypothetical protein